jgi:hypothetical protein
MEGRFGLIDVFAGVATQWNEMSRSLATWNRHTICGSLLRPDDPRKDSSRLRQSAVLQTNYWEKTPMKTRLVSSLLLGLGFVLLTGDLAAADELRQQSGESQSDGLSGLIDAVGRFPMSSLSGLIKPEKMGILTDNQCRIRDNEAHLLSDNESDFDLLSGNELSLLSGVRLFSGFTINVHVTMDRPDTKAPQAKHGKHRRESRKAKRNKAARRTKKL